MDTPDYWRGRESMQEEIAKSGWDTSRDRFNATNPPGQPWAGNSKQFEFAQGEYDALSAAMK